MTLEIDTCLSTFDPSRFNDTTSQCLTKLWQEDYDIYDLLKKKVFHRNIIIVHCSENQVGTVVRIVLILEHNV